MSSDAKLQVLKFRSKVEVAKEPQLAPANDCSFVLISQSPSNTHCNTAALLTVVSSQQTIHNEVLLKCRLQIIVMIAASQMFVNIDQLCYYDEVNNHIDNSASHDKI